MKLKTGFFSLLSLVCSASLAQAAPADLIWSNTNGFVSAAHCQINPVKNNPFYISQGKKSSSLDYTDLQNSRGVRQSYLLNRSLVRLKEDKKRSGYKSVDVIGISQTPKAPITKWFATRMDSGYLADSSLKNLQDYVIEIKSGVSAKEIPSVQIPTAGTFWQLAVEDGQTLGFTCKMKNTSVDYYMFNVFVTNQDQPVAHVGVSAEDTGIFKSIMTHLPSEADKILDSRMEEAPSDHRQSLETATHSGSVTAGLSPLEVAREAGEVLKSQKEELQQNINKPVDGTFATAKPISGTSQAAVKAQPTASATDDDDEEGDDDTLKAINSSQEYVVCINEDTLAVRDDSLSNVLFRAEKAETVLMTQSWDTPDKKVKNINGKDYTFVKVQFPERDGKNTGWLAQDYIRLEGQCSVTRKEETSTKMTPITQGGPIKNIDSEACCQFPTIKRPTHSYLSGMRRFKAGRSRGKRLHAACDLYRVHGEQAVSIADGKVITGLYYFYQGTYAMEVQYPGGTVARYGELTGKAAKGVSNGAKVTRGQTLGYIGTVNSGCCLPMLHFELYSGKGKGSLSTRGNKFQRRSDLMDPTKYLLKWEKKTFGTSY